MPELKLKDWKLEDIDIFNSSGLRLPAPIDSVVIRQLSVHDWFMKYIPFMQRVIRIFGFNIPQGDIFGKDAKDQYLLNIKMQVMKFAANLAFLNELINFLRDVKIISGSRKKWFSILTPDQVILIFMYMYLFNTDGLKKKLFYLTENVLMTKKERLATSSSNVIETRGSTKIVHEIKR